MSNPNEWALYSEDILERSVIYVPWHMCNTKMLWWKSALSGGPIRYVTTYRRSNRISAAPDEICVVRTKSFLGNIVFCCSDMTYVKLGVINTLIGDQWMRYPSKNKTGVAVDSAQLRWIWLMIQTRAGLGSEIWCS